MMMISRVPIYSVGISIKELGGGVRLPPLPFPRPLPSFPRPLPSLPSPIPLPLSPRRKAAPVNPARGSEGAL